MLIRIVFKLVRLKFQSPIQYWKTIYLPYLFSHLLLHIKMSSDFVCFIFALMPNTQMAEETRN